MRHETTPDAGPAEAGQESHGVRTGLSLFRESLVLRLACAALLSGFVWLAIHWAKT